MTPEQRYLFDLQGFLHLESALSDAELSAAQNALSCLESIPDEENRPLYDPLDATTAEVRVALERAARGIRGRP